MSERNLIIDTYSGHKKGRAELASLLTEPDVVGAILKATEGRRFDTSWFEATWEVAREVAGDRYGDTWFRGAYHYLKFTSPGQVQADFFVDTVERAGGFVWGDLIPVVDVELGVKGKNTNWDASADLIVQTTTAFADRVKERTGQEVMLYGNGAMRDKGITSRMGCDWLWIPRYTATLPRQMYERAGWTLDRVALWQYTGEGAGRLAGYPTEYARWPGVDISVVLLPTLADFRGRLVGQCDWSKIEIEPVSGPTAGG